MCTSYGNIKADIKELTKIIDKMLEYYNNSMNCRFAEIQLYTDLIEIESFKIKYYLDNGIFL